MGVSRKAWAARLLPRYTRTKARCFSDSLKEVQEHSLQGAFVCQMSG